jgi:hypothetical protein
MVCRWQRTAQKKFSARRKARYSFAVSRPTYRPVRTVADLVDILADPVERVQIAQAALALLDVGFDDIAAVAQPLVPLVALGQLLGHELALGAGHHFGPEAGLASANSAWSPQT